MRVPSARAITDVIHDKPPDFIHRLACFWNKPRARLEYVPHARPYLDFNIDSASTGALSKTHRVAQEYFTVANMNAKRWQARQVDIRGRQQRCLRILAANGV